MAAANLWVAGSRGRARRPRRDGRGISPFPYALIFPQDEHERLLIDRLAEAGVEVERRTELVDFRRRPAACCARLKRRTAPEETCEAAYIAGCDGAHSTRARGARRSASRAGPTSTLLRRRRRSARGAAMNGELHVALDTTDFLAVFPLKGEGRARLIGTVRDERRTAARAPVVGRREPARDRVDAHRRRARELVLDLSRASPRRRPLPQGPRVPARRRRAHPQPGRRAGHEHRHRRRGESRLEARRCRARTRATRRCSTPTSRNASPSRGAWSRRPIRRSRA